MDDINREELIVQEQISTIKEWSEITVAVILALFESNMTDSQLDAKVPIIGAMIRERVLGNHGHFPIASDADLKLMYRRIVEATLRWAIEKTLES
jgi:hypothetical protein